MEEMLIRAVKANRAHIKTKKQQFPEKYEKVIADVWSKKEFYEQCEKQTWTTVQKIFRGLCDRFRSKHGYGDSGMRVNLSALPDIDDLSESDALLHDMCKEIASQIEDTDNDKKMKGEKKKVIMDITDVIQSGEGKTGMVKLANDMKVSGTAYLSGKTDHFVQGLSTSSKSIPVESGSVVKATSATSITVVTGEVSTKMRKLSRSDIEGEDLMRTFGEQFRREDLAEAARMATLEETIRSSGEATAAAITAGNEETARANRALFGMLSSLLNR